MLLLGLLRRLAVLAWLLPEVPRGHWHLLLTELSGQNVEHGVTLALYSTNKGALADHIILYDDTIKGYTLV